MQDLGIDGLTDDYIIQEVARGYEVSIDFAVDRSGNLLGISLRRQLEARTGEVSKAITIDHCELREQIEYFATLLPGAFGILNVEVFVDDETECVSFIEMNPRFAGGYPLSWHAGARFPLSLINWPGESARLDANPGLLMLRYDQAVFADASSFSGALP